MDSNYNIDDLQHNHISSMVFNSIKYISILTMVSVGGLTIATICVSMFLYSDYNSWKKNNDSFSNSASDAVSDSDAASDAVSDSDAASDAASDVASYEDKYMDIYNELKDRDMEESELDALKYIFICDKTPNGLIKMYYDKNSESFCYFSDTKDIAYKYLETSGRLYVTEHDCKSLFVNLQDELNKATENLANKILQQKEKLEKQKELENQKKVDEVKNKSVFAIFKNYNTDTITNKNTDSTCDSNTVIVPAKSNHYIYKGKLLDYENYIKFNTLENTDNDYEHLDYSAFKNLDEKKTL